MFGQIIQTSSSLSRKKIFEKNGGQVPAILFSTCAEELFILASYHDLTLFRGKEGIRLPFAGADRRGRIMNAEERRESILQELIQAAGEPVSASSLAGRFNVSRQIIVGDVALLRASGADISATPRGYVMQSLQKGLVRQVACRHTEHDIEKELNAIVDQGCTVLDVIVEHPVYGQLTGPLHLRSRFDVSQFVKRCRELGAVPLSGLTDGIHLHTILCPDLESYERVTESLDRLGFLFSM